VDVSSLHENLVTEKKQRTSLGILCVQLLILLLCGTAIFLLVWNFPYPSPLIKPFLPPKLRWPTAQVMSWVEQGQFDRDFSRYFARDPERIIPVDATLVSPADGIVQNISFMDGVTYLVVGLSFWDVHVVRTPIAGTIKSIDMEGSYLDKLSPLERYSEENFLRGKAAPVQAVLTLETDRGDVKIRMITSYWSSRLKIWVYPGEKLAIGDRIGRIVLGSTVVAEFPGKLPFKVKLGEHVSAGSSPLMTH
jgi:phosphatidylserine decarboxylase